MKLAHHLKENIMKFALRFVCLAAICCGSPIARAATVTFYADAASFDSAVGPTTFFDYDDSGFETVTTIFESPTGILDGVLTNTLVNSPIDLGSFSLEIRGGNNTFDDTKFDVNDGLFPNQSDEDGILSLALFPGFGEHDAFRFIFDTPITSFSADLASLDNDLLFDFAFSSGATDSFLLSNTTSPNFIGFGFDEPVSDFTVTAPSGDMRFFLSDRRPTAIPEPSGIAAVLVVGIGFVVNRRRRRN